MSIPMASNKQVSYIKSLLKQRPSFQHTDKLLAMLANNELDIDKASKTIQYLLAMPPELANANANTNYVPKNRNSNRRYH